MEREFALKTKGLIKSYDNSHALNGIDLEVKSTRLQPAGNSVPRGVTIAMEGGG